MKTYEEINEVFNDMMKAERTAQMKRELLFAALIERIK